MVTKKKPPPADLHNCGACDSYRPVNPGDEAGYCHLNPPAWVETEEDGAGWIRPVVTPDDVCRWFMRRLNS